MNYSLPLGTYRHYKGNLYKVIAIGEHTETDESLVIYSPVDNPDKYWVRPLDMFLETIEVDGVTIPRFAPENQ